MNRIKTFQSTNVLTFFSFAMFFSCKVVFAAGEISTVIVNIFRQRLWAYLIPTLFMFGVIIFVCGVVVCLIDHIKKVKRRNIAKWLLFSGIFLIVSMIGLWGVLGYFQPPLLQVHEGSQIILASDVTQNPILLGTAHNVFVAKIYAHVSTADSPTGIRTQYSAEVIENIKGHLAGAITVEQEGGIKDGVLYTVGDASPLLTPGSTYLLATRYNKAEDRYTIIAHQNAIKLLSDNSNFSDVELQALIAQDEKVKTLEAAYPNEQLLDVDIAHQNTRNAFRDLPPDAKATATLRADTARAQLEVERGGR